MRAGIFLAYWPWFTPQEQVELAVLADGLGLDSVWISEAWGQDAVSVLGHLAAKTERIALGSGLFQIPARAPTATAMAAGALTPGLLDAMALATTPGRLDDRLAAFAGVGVDTLVGVPCGSDRARVVRALAEATR